MSQPDALFSDSSIDPPFPSMDEAGFTQEQLDDCFAAQDGDPTFSSASSEALGDLDFNFDNGSIAQTDSSNPTTVSTPDFSGYTFGQQNTSVYPTLCLNTPHPYPLQLQQTSYPPSGQRPLPIRSQTNTSSLHPSQNYARVHQPNHRRSLSHGDAERIAAYTQATPNPVFFRTHAPRAYSTAPEDEVTQYKKRMDPYAKGRQAHVRSTSQGPRRGRGRVLTSVPVPVPRSVGLNEIVPTSIGTPLRLDGTADMTDTLMRCSGLNDTYFVHMSDEDKIKHSKRVIEIGAMAVLNRPALDPEHRRTRSQAPSPEDKIEDEPQDRRGAIMVKLEEVEQHLKYELGDCERVLKGCGMIRDALIKKCEDEAQQATVQGGQEATVVPSSIFPGEDGAFCDADDGDLISMFVGETGDGGFETHGL